MREANMLVECRMVTGTREEVERRALEISREGGRTLLWRRALDPAATSAEETHFAQFYRTVKP